MPTYTQADRPMRVTTPLGKDAVLLVGFTGQEAVSQLFSFQLDLIAENDKDVAFDKLLGQKVSVDLLLPDKSRRFFSGICNRFSQGTRSFTFTSYRLEMVPQFWLLTRRAQDRIFQHVAVPDILKKVFEGLDVEYQLQGKFEPRDFVVQYRETDFNFASRLMEEEGIFYFFKHADGSHKMVVANTPQSHPDMPAASQLIFEELPSGKRDEDRIISWEKTQELRSGKVLLWDHNFELPYKHLEADKTILETVQVGKVSHKQSLANNTAKLEIYDYPGEYAQRFDGVNKGGGEQPAELQKIFQDNKRTVGIRMEQEAVQGLVLKGLSTCRQLVTGHKFTLTRHFNADGPYLLTSVQHDANVSMDYRSDGRGGGEYRYQNSFTAIPFAQPFRPPRVTPKPFVQGTQTATVVGPKGEEIFTDKYGRVKVQFHWDREGKFDADSSCWVRVGQPWAGKRWGYSHVPRIGHEVIVDFLEGDPDQPIIIGSVYNADQMPPYLGKGLDSKHPHDPKLSGLKSNSTLGGDGFNEWRFDDTKGKEQIFMHAERNMDVRVKHDSMERVIHDRHLIVGNEKDGKKVGDQREQVFQDKHLNVKRHQEEHIEGSMKLLIGHGEAKDNPGNLDVVLEKNRKTLIGENDHLHVKKAQKIKVDGTQDILIGSDKKEKVSATSHVHVTKDRNEKVDGTQSLTVGKNQQEKVGQNHALDAGMEIHLKAGMKVIIEAGMQLSLKGPGGFIDIGPTGVAIQGAMVLINSGGAAGSGSGSSPTAPEAPSAAEDAEKAKPIVPTKADNSVTGKKSVPEGLPGPAPGPTGV